MYSPNWLYGMVPEGWWPDRPREMVDFIQNVQTIAVADGIQVFELTMAKEDDVLVWGGVALVTTVPSGGAPPSVFGPTLASGTSYSTILAQLASPSAGEVYSQAFSGTANAANNLVPLESLFGCGQRPGTKPVFWPIPLRVMKGGSLQLSMQVLAGAAKQVRIAFKTSVMYREREVA